MRAWERCRRSATAFNSIDAFGTGCGAGILAEIVNLRSELSRTISLQAPDLLVRPHLSSTSAPFYECKTPLFSRLPAVVARVFENPSGSRGVSKVEIARFPGFSGWAASEKGQKSSSVTHITGGIRTSLILRSYAEIHL